MTKGGERFKMVRQLRRIGGKPDVEPEPDVTDTVDDAKTKEEMAMFLSTSPGWTPLHDIMGAAFGDDWEEAGIAEAKKDAEVKEWQKRLARNLKAMKELERQVNLKKKSQGADWIYVNRRLRDEYERTEHQIKIAKMMLKQLGVG